MMNFRRFAVNQAFPSIKRAICGNSEQKKTPYKTFDKIMIANRGEVAIRISRACKEMGINTIGIYSHQDRLSAHRSYMDQSFLLGKGQSPIAAYLNIPEIICIAKNNGADAIHPGYGFLSEREDFAQEVIASGMEFIGPRPEVLRTLGDKSLARDAALRAGVPIIPGSTDPITDVQKVKEFCKEFGLPIMLKAAYGGGGRGMRLVLHEDDIEEMFKGARSESLAAFGKDEMLVEKYIESPRHIEVQILGDKQGNVVHLFERDCTMQRRYQKVVQIAPAQNLSPRVRDTMTDMSVLLTKSIGYSSAGTVEFLVDRKDDLYFIEVNPRLQVEHTLTEEITGVDIVQAQIKIAQGMSLSALGIVQENIRKQGCAIQCHLRTEDPARNFQPSSGILDFFTAPAGLGIRLDSSCPYAGQHIFPDYDSLLVKIITHSSSYQTSCQRMKRALKETKPSGLITNLPFLLNVFENEKFLSGEALATTFIDDHPGLLVRRDFEHRGRGEKILQFLAQRIVNGPKTLMVSEKNTAAMDPEINIKINACDKIRQHGFYKMTTDSKDEHGLKGFRYLIKQRGSDTFVDYMRKLKTVHLMDTTFRDAHQSLLSARVRTYDLKKVSPFVSQRFHDLYAIEMWGGAVFHSSLKYLRECPWERLNELRELIPNIPFQMLLRGNSLMGYQNYDSDDVRTFCRLAVMGGIDIFRVFDPINDVSNLMKGINTIDKEAGDRVLIEAALCYLGDLSDPENRKYTLGYYEHLADQLIQSGVKALCLKDMTGLLNPQAANLLISLLREKFPNILISVHTHDTSGTAVANMLACVEAGADVIDVCADSMSGETSQPAMGAIIERLTKNCHGSGLNIKDVSAYSSYWAKVRSLYEPFIHSDMKRSTSETCIHQISGCHYSNLHFQATSLGLDFDQVKKAYAEVNFVIGDIIGVTPNFKIVTDLALFMAKNKLTYLNIQDNADNLILPISVVEFFKSSIIEPSNGFPKDIRAKILVKSKNYGIEASATENEKIIGNVVLTANREENAGTQFNMLMFPEENKAYLKFRKTYGRTDKLPTRIFLHGLRLGEEFEFEFGPGDKANIQLLCVSTNLNKYGERTVFFLYNGQARSIFVRDATVRKEMYRSKVDENNRGEVGAPMPGTVEELKVQSGQRINRGDLLYVMTSMKMEVLVHAPIDGLVKELWVQPGSEVEENDLILTIDVTD